jgi:hypothetical protein
MAGVAYRPGCADGHRVRHRCRDSPGQLNSVRDTQRHERGGSPCDGGVRPIRRLCGPLNGSGGWRMVGL